MIFLAKHLQNYAEKSRLKFLQNFAKKTQKYLAKITNICIIQSRKNKYRFKSLYVPLKGPLFELVGVEDEDQKNVEEDTRHTATKRSLQDGDLAVPGAVTLRPMYISPKILS